ncbi:MAG: primosomal protein N' family DNA-binding protein [Ilumatobacteraceae bacterium]
MGVAVATQRVQGSRQTLIAHVVPDVTGIDKIFDYLVPEALTKDLVIGSRVRVPLHNRKVAGWVVGLTTDVTNAGQAFALDPARLLPISAMIGRGPSNEIVELGKWATQRWAGRLRAFCVAGSPDKVVPKLPAVRYSAKHPIAGEDVGDIEWALSERNTVVLRRGPHADLARLVATCASHGPTLVVIPTLYRARMMAAALRGSGLTVAVMSEDWAQGAGGVDVIIGSRSAIWASAPRLSSIVVIDEHDDGLQEERSPTWHARDVAIERARRLGISCLLITPVPSIAAYVAAGARQRSGDAQLEHKNWPKMCVIDRSSDERWASSLLSSELIAELRDHSRRIVCVLNTKGRARLLACAQCRAIVRCEVCDAAVHLNNAGIFECPRCSAQRPQVCLECRASKFALLKLGINRLREELAAAAGRKVTEVVEVSGSAKSNENFNSAAMLFVGTEAVLHRVHQADTVVLLDVDAELFAPRYRATEITLGLITLAARLARKRADGGRVMLQTHSPHHELFRALESLEFNTLLANECDRRRALSMPPFGALAHITGAGTSAYAAELAANMLVNVATLGDDDVIVRAASATDLVATLQSTTKPKGSRLKIQIDPPRI